MPKVFLAGGEEFVEILVPREFAVTDQGEHFNTVTGFYVLVPGEALSKLEIGHLIPRFRVVNGFLFSELD
jgi:hypothetical protein